jgi:ABC-2 type transport system ATP-binding protein
VDPGVSAALCVMTGRDDGWVIEAIELTTRRRRGRRALEAVSFQVRPGQVTGLLGLPGSGKTAVLRRMLQLERGGGRTLYDGRPFRSLTYPIRSVGVLLDPLAVHPGRTVAGHLRLALSADPEAASAGPRERIEAVLDVVGLTDQARSRIFELTEGMTVRLGLAQALLGDPQALLLDEPEYGLEPEGRPWLAALLRAYAAQGRCVLVTGRNTEAMLGYADRILVLESGRLIGQRTARQAARELAGDCVIVRTPQALRLAAILVAAGAEPTQLDGACLEVRGLDRARIGDLAFRNEVPLHELSVRSPAQDPVIAALEACRRPPAVVPVQTPPTASVPEAAEASVRMPFEGALAQPEREPEREGVAYRVSPFGEDSAVLSVSVGPPPSAGTPSMAGVPTTAGTPYVAGAPTAAGALPVTEPSADAPTQLISVVAAETPATVAETARAFEGTSESAAATASASANATSGGELSGTSDGSDGRAPNAVEDEPAESPLFPATGPVAAAAAVGSASVGSASSSREPESASAGSASAGPVAAAAASVGSPSVGSASVASASVGSVSPSRAPESTS